MQDNMTEQFVKHPKGPFTQAIFAAIFLLLMHAIKWIDINQYFCDSTTQSHASE